MSEGLLLIVWICKFLLVGLSAVLYRIGGWVNKAVRRFIMPIVYIGGCALIALWKGNYTPLIFISLPLLIGSLCLGYGADTFLKKLKRRFIYGLALSFAFLPFAFIYNNWILYGWHCGLCIFSSTIFGVFNPFSSAVDEEATLATVSLLMPVMMI